MVETPNNGMEEEGGGAFMVCLWVEWPMWGRGDHEQWKSHCQNALEGIAIPSAFRGGGDDNEKEEEESKKEPCDEEME